MNNLIVQANSPIVEVGLCYPHACYLYQLTPSTSERDLLCIGRAIDGCKVRDQEVSESPLEILGCDGVLVYVDGLEWSPQT